MSTTTTDPIADMLSRIRNAIAVNKNEITLPHSKIKQSVAEILAANRYLTSVKTEDAGVGKNLRITIYAEGTNATITEISRMSSPGRRLYVSSEDIPTVKGGRGIVVISTSQGVMTGKEAKNKKLGGELICKVY